MNRGIILFQSKYGATQKYADWLSHLTGYDCTPMPQADIHNVENYDTILLCGGIYASGIAGLSFLKKNIRRLKHKNIVIFCVGASPYDAAALDQIKAHNLKADLKDTPLFYGRGAWDEGKMTFKDRTLCKLLQKSIAKKDPDSYEPWMEALMAAAGKTCDWTDQNYLLPVLDYLGLSVSSARTP